MYQRMVLVGNLGRDPETHYSASGIPVTNFSVATTSRWSDASGEPHEETVWFRIAAFGKQAETCQEFLTKGQRVLVEGTLIADPANGSPRIFTRKDGTPGSAFEIRANTVRFLSPRGEKGNGSAQADNEQDDFEQEPLFN